MAAQQGCTKDLNELLLRETDLSPNVFGDDTYLAKIGFGVWWNQLYTWKKPYIYIAGSHGPHEMGQTSSQRKAESGLPSSLQLSNNDRVFPFSLPLANPS